MKKYIIILFAGIHLQSWGQNFIKSTVPCNDALMQKTPGRWIKDKNNVYASGLNKAQIQEMLNRLNNIQLLVLKTYPNPIGVDATWFPSVSEELFGSQLKFSKTTDGESKYTLVNGIPVGYSSYNCGFFAYACGRNQYEIMTGWPGETTTHLFVFANNLNEFFMDDQLEPELREAMCVDGRPIRMMPTIKRMWKGYPLYYQRDSSWHWVLLHRDGMLPYIPVTRKQYLDRCIDYISKFYDPKIKSLESIPDKEQRDELVKNYRKQKEDQLKHYKDELEATTAAKLLDTPAIIPLYLFDISNNPIFSTEETGGHMLVTENPAYIRKDLPKYMPQFIVMTWTCADWKPQQEVCKAVEEYFPIEKLQAMIDK
ncbi:MAG: hypothetical protein WBW16_11245 [Bacteroidota bacterium]